MIEFIIQYWVQFLLVTISGGLTIACKRIYNLYKKEKVHQKTKEQTEFYEGLKELIQQGAEQSRQAEASLQEQINIVKEGVLSIQKKNFKQECRELLREDHDITLGEFETLQEEYHVYKNLGGNHDGDTYYEMVVKKTTNSLADKK